MAIMISILHLLKLNQTHHVNSNINKKNYNEN